QGRYQPVPIAFVLVFNDLRFSHHRRECCRNETCCRCETFATREGLLLNGRRRSPLLASPQGGVAERSRKCREASFESEDGVVFRAGRAENLPGCVGFGGFALILDDAATPPCGDARRGLRLRPLSNNPVSVGLNESVNELFFWCKARTQKTSPVLFGKR